MRACVLMGVCVSVCVYVSEEFKPCNTIAIQYKRGEERSS